MTSRPINVPLLLATLFFYLLVVARFKSAKSYLSTVLLSKLARRALCGKSSDGLTKTTSGSSGSCSVMAAWLSGRCAVLSSIFLRR